MGAKNNSQLKKTNPNRTELVITDDPYQETVIQAAEWRIPVVKLEWLFQSAKKKEKLPLNLYLLFPSSQPTIDSPPRFHAILSSDRSKIFVCDPAFELEDAEVYFPHGTTPLPKNEETITNLEQFDFNLSEITHQPPESYSPRFKVELSTQEVYDNFDIQCRDSREAELSPSDPPPSQQSRWKKTGRSELKMPRESRRFSSLYHQKKSLVQNYHIQQETRPRVLWDPLPYMEDSPPQLPSRDTAPESNPKTDS